MSALKYLLLFIIIQIFKYPIAVNGLLVITLTEMANILVVHNEIGGLVLNIFFFSPYGLQALPFSG
jgi:hypothetical protein